MVKKRYLYVNSYMIIDNENEAEENFLAKKYVEDMIEIHKDHNTIRERILSNLVNSEYGRTSNSFVTKVWQYYRERFPS